jgi:hypothetical protein
MLLICRFASVRWVGKRLIAALIAVSLSSVIAFAGASEENALRATQDSLRKDGFKLDLNEFDFTTPIKMRTRVAALTNLVLGGRVARNAEIKIDLLEPAGIDSAVVIWTEKELLQKERNNGWSDPGDMWPQLQRELEGVRIPLDAASAAALAGPIRFHLDAAKGNGMLLPHLAGLKQLSQRFGKYCLLELHNGHPKEAWTNLFASIRLVTAWKPEPTEVSNLVWFMLMKLAFDNVWQALQAPVWTGQQLERFQQEFEKVRFFADLSEIPAFTRACMAASYQQERQQPIQSGISAQQAIRDPKGTWNQAGDYLSRLKYRDHGSLEDEEAALLHYRNRELEYKRAVQCTNWLEMRRLPGVTNTIPFQSGHSSSVQSMINMRQLALRLQGLPLLVAAAEAETRRRIVVAAIALERFHLSRGAYPKTLEELTPIFLKGRAIDFIDGQPLRYDRTQDGHFVLYSVGLDGVDNGGVLKASSPINTPDYRPTEPDVASVTALTRSAVKSEGDLVWPRPAAISDVNAKRAKDESAWQKLQEAAEIRDEVEAQETEVERLEQARKILGTSWPKRTSEPLWNGRPLRILLQRKNQNGEPVKTIDELLTPTPIITGAEPQFATFELPISYDAITNQAERCGLRLVIDPIAGDDDLDGGTEGQVLTRAPDGGCSIALNTIFYRPTTHALQATFEIQDFSTNLSIPGPPIPLVVSNLCQLSARNFNFDADGARFFIKLAETNGQYKIEINSDKNERLKTISGASTNGLIRARWDLRDAHGARYTNDSFRTTIHITLPDSGRSQTIK